MASTLCYVDLHPHDSELYSIKFEILLTWRLARQWCSTTRSEMAFLGAALVDPALLFGAVLDASGTGNVQCSTVQNCKVH
jgi:hypothetical protein